MAMQIDESRLKFIRFAGWVEVVCAFGGFMYVMFGNHGTAKDVMITILFAIMGAYFLGVGYGYIKPDSPKK